MNRIMERVFGLLAGLGLLIGALNFAIGDREDALCIILMAIAMIMLENQCHRDRQEDKEKF